MTSKVKDAIREVVQLKPTQTLQESLELLEGALKAIKDQDRCLTNVKVSQETLDRLIKRLKLFKGEFPLVLYDTPPSIYSQGEFRGAPVKLNDDLELYEIHLESWF